jgi:transposase
MLPAMSLDGILTYHILEDGVTADVFNEFISNVLDHMNPFPQPNSVIVMDNASIHKSDDLREMVENRFVQFECVSKAINSFPFRGMRMLYLPAYSPDLNPIEEAFSAMKSWMRTNNVYVLQEFSNNNDADPYGVIAEAIETITPEKAHRWFRHSGYITEFH